MGTYFFDTSAIIKQYFREQGHTWVRNLHEPAQHQLHISQAALVEVVATICRKAREQNITTAKRDALIDTFRQDVQNVYIVRLVNASVYTFAGDLCRSYLLRAYDAVQLACALNLRTETLANQVAAPTFVCADNGLINIALAEGFSIENPNNYP